MARGNLKTRISGLERCLERCLERRLQRWSKRVFFKILASLLANICIWRLETVREPGPEQWSGCLALLLAENRLLFFASRRNRPLIHSSTCLPSCRRSTFHASLVIRRPPPNSWPKFNADPSPSAGGQVVQSLRVWRCGSGRIYGATARSFLLKGYSSPREQIAHQLSFSYPDSTTLPPTAAISSSSSPERYR